MLWSEAMELIAPPAEVDTKAKGRKRAVEDKTSASKRAKIGEGDTAADTAAAADDAQPHVVEVGTGSTVYQLYHRAFEYASSRILRVAIYKTQPSSSLIFLDRFDALSSRAVASVLTRHGVASAVTCHILLLISRDNIVCNRSMLKYFKAETLFTELQSLRAAGATLPGSTTAVPTMSLAELTRSADLLCNCTQVCCLIS
jgi:hypothetical protein